MQNQSLLFHDLSLYLKIALFFPLQITMLCRNFLSVHSLMVCIITKVYSDLHHIHHISHEYQPYIICGQSHSATGGIISIEGLAHCLIHTD